MKVVQHPNPASFLEATAGFRSTHPTRTNIMGSVATSAVDGRTYAAEFWYSITDDADRVIGCAMRTPPWFLAVSPMPREAAAELARTVHRVDPGVPGVVGPREVADALTIGFGRQDIARTTMVELLRVLGTYLPPSPVSGIARPAVHGDLDLVISWLGEFNAEAGLMPATKDELVEVVGARMADEALLLWTDNGEPVSLSGHAPLVTTPGGTVGRIGPVYTPPRHRGRGYGTAATAAMVEVMQPRCDMIMLFTDATNPTSNGIYARLGFEIVDEIVELAFS
jgi:predicted GNAT family acetyltransferase